MYFSVTYASEHGAVYFVWRLFLDYNQGLANSTKMSNVTHSGEKHREFVVVALSWGYRGHEKAVSGASSTEGSWDARSFWITSKPFRVNSHLGAWYLSRLIYGVWRLEAFSGSTIVFRSDRLLKFFQVTVLIEQPLLRKFCPLSSRGWDIPIKVRRRLPGFPLHWMKPDIHSRKVG